MTHSSPHMRIEVPIASITAVSLWGHGGAAPHCTSQEASLGILTALPVALHAVSLCTQTLFLAASVTPLSLLLPLTYNLKYKLTGVGVVLSHGVRRHSEQGDTTRGSAYGVLVTIHCSCSLLQDNNGA